MVSILHFKAKFNQWELTNLRPLWKTTWNSARNMKLESLANWEVISTRFKYLSLIQWLLDIAMIAIYWKWCLIRWIHRAETKYSKGMRFVCLHESINFDHFLSHRKSVFVFKCHDSQINQLTSFKFPSRISGVELRSFWSSLSRE